MLPAKVRSVIDLAQQVATNTYVPPPSFQRIYSITIGTSVAVAGPKLASKYGVCETSEQVVVCVTNQITHDQTWYNEQRTRKPQTFKATSATPEDPIADPATQCDFCQWQDLTAADTFGRFEAEYAVTASNLFKYCQPCHGVVLFKHHDPLHFQEHHIRDLLDVSLQWLVAAHSHNPSGVHPLFIWNCLPRAGASQFHGHAQVLLSAESFPDVMRWMGRRHCDAPHMQIGLWGEMIAAHAAIGLLTSVCLTEQGQSSEGSRVFVWPSLAPVKDMEVFLLGKSMCDPSFVKALHTVLRLMIDELHVKTFNVAIFGMELVQDTTGEASDASLHAAAEIPTKAGEAANAGPDLLPHRPVVARIVSRGKLSSKASDFGALEVLAGASIGHTDPYTLHAAIQEKLRAPIWTHIAPEALL